jgi:hypothetical protein
LDGSTSLDVAMPRRSTSSLGAIGALMPTFQQIFPFIPLLMLAFFAWRYFKNGSLVGALLGGRLTETIGEISLPSSGFTSRVLRVSLMAAPEGGAKDVALAITSKAALGASVVPVKLSHAQALELLRLLQRATAR